ncbi:MAG TPA: hypothetical protein DEP84_28380 [Chloroflexi bacterium]|nr:hypothetical protein [Chloroflexota bacterium]
MFDPAKIRFRRLRASDLGLMHTWLNTDPVMRWYGNKPCSYDEVVQEYVPSINGQQPTDPFLILYEEIPIGYIQTYKIADYPDYSRYVQVDEDAAGLDLFIGEAQYIHRGLGSLVLTRFLREIVFQGSDTVSCLVGPEPQNTVAIKAYEKAGFRYLKTVQLPDEEEPESLMRIAREDVLGG